MLGIVTRYTTALFTDPSVDIVIRIERNFEYSCSPFHTTWSIPTVPSLSSVCQINSLVFPVKVVVVVMAACNPIDRGLLKHGCEETSVD
jgi:hypothetical protein